MAAERDLHIRECFFCLRAVGPHENLSVFRVPNAKPVFGVDIGEEAFLMCSQCQKYADDTDFLASVIGGYCLITAYPTMSRADQEKYAEDHRKQVEATRALRARARETN